MPSGELLKVIESVGLDQKESQLYLTGLQLGSAPASEYANRSGFNRITTYNYLESLTKRGVFTAVKKDRGKWYTPISPEELSLEARKNVDALERLLPELRSLQGSEHRKPHVRFYEGGEGVKRVYEDTLTAQSELLNYANSAIVRANWENYDEDYVAKRVKSGIYLRGIAPDDEAGRKVMHMDKYTNREIRLVPGDEFDFNNEIHIYDNKVAICAFGKEQADAFAVIMESKEVADTQRQIFEMAWRYAKMVK